ncbi:Atu4866 domain-containing protein [Jidongwangia harbinensis]|uniref:Atu4866 domain-containing protein n=1 Tax=Jidongwangia harbinensis TaxID=2878561 RepID=UPI001CD91F0E|nr:Atu4866 domain-containing protein [Jidongwangia harbinensis]MCA2219463.1 Atu4866 domain-containing protein [Jidongwangia harbinensis]
MFAPARLVAGPGRFVTLVAVFVAVAACRSEPGPAPSGDTHPYVGMWVTADQHIRQELRADGRYDEARGQRASAYTGRYEVTGDHIEYWDDAGFTADGRFDGDVLHHGGYLFYREGSPAHRRAAGEPGATRRDG